MQKPKPPICLDTLPPIDEAFANSDGGAKIAWHSAGSTHPGRVRHANEDAFFESIEQRLWAVADGMGGYSRGDYASRAVKKSLGQFKRLPTLKENIESLENLFNKTNDACLNAFRGKRVGTTVAALLAFQHRVFCIWAGDSRIYRLRDQQLEQITLDHTVAQEKLARNEISAEEVDLHATAHILTRAIGVHTKLQVEFKATAVKPNDRYLLCSDGLYNELQNSQILNILCYGNPETAADKLIDLAIHQGGRDNITAVVVDAASHKG